jgi:hypothetical protein
MFVLTCQRFRFDRSIRYTELYSGDELAFVARALDEYGFDVWEPSGEVSIDHRTSIHATAKSS